MHESINWTHEVMEENLLAYLDAQTDVELDRSLSFKIYRKPTHTNQYLNFDSNHHIGHKLSVVKSMNIRAETLVTKAEDIDSEKDLLKDAFRRCKYPKWAIEHHEKSKNKEKVNNDEEVVGKIVAPYVKGTSEKLAKIMRSHGIEVIHRPFNKIKNLVCSMKQSVHPLDRDGLIYDFDCEKHYPNPDETLYVGETDRAKKERGYEHRHISHADATKCHSCVPFEVEDNMINNTESNTEAPVRRSQRNRTRMDYSQLANSGDREEIGF